MYRRGRCGLRSGNDARALHAIVCRTLLIAPDTNNWSECPILTTKFALSLKTHSMRSTTSSKRLLLSYQQRWCSHHGHGTSFAGSHVVSGPAAMQ